MTTIAVVDDEDTVDKFVSAIRKLKKTQSKLIKEVGVAIIPQKVSGIMSTVSRNIGRDKDLVPVDYDEMEEPRGIYLITSDYEEWFSVNPTDVDEGEDDEDVGVQWDVVEDDDGESVDHHSFICEGEGEEDGRRRKKGRSKNLENERKKKGRRSRKVEVEGGDDDESFLVDSLGSAEGPASSRSSRRHRSKKIHL